MKLFKTLIFLLIIKISFGQKSIISKLNTAIKEQDIHLVYKNFSDKYVFSTIERRFGSKPSLYFKVISEKRNNNRYIILTELIDIKDTTKIINVVNFYCELIDSINYINAIIFNSEINSKQESLISENYLSKNINLPYIQKQGEKYPKLDSLGRDLVTLFQKNKAMFLKKYFSPENCDNSIGDTWAARDFDRKKELVKVEYNESYFDEKIKAATISLNLYFEETNIYETDILYFKVANNGFNYFFTSQNFDFLLFLE